MARNDRPSSLPRLACHQCTEVVKGTSSCWFFYCSTNPHQFGGGSHVIFEVGVGTERKNLRIFYGPDQKEANGLGTAPAERETSVRHQGSHMHETMGTVLHPINSASRYAIARFIGSTLHFDRSTHGWHAAPFLLNLPAFDVSRIRHLCVSDGYTPSRVAVITFDSWQLMRVAPSSF